MRKERRIRRDLGSHTMGFDSVHALGVDEMGGFQQGLRKTGCGGDSMWWGGR